MPSLVEERQGITQKGVHAINAWKPAAINAEKCCKTSVRAPGLSTEQCEHPFVWCSGAGRIGAYSGGLWTPPPPKLPPNPQNRLQRTFEVWKASSFGAGPNIGHKMSRAPKFHRAESIALHALLTVHPAYTSLRFSACMHPHAVHEATMRDPEAKHKWREWQNWTQTKHDDNNKDLRNI